MTAAWEQLRDIGPQSVEPDQPPPPDEPTVTLTHSQLAEMIGQAVAAVTNTDAQVASAAALQSVSGATEDDSSATIQPDNNSRPEAD